MKMMDDNEKFTMYDEEGILRNAEILYELELNNNRYLIYSLEKDSDSESTYASKIVIDNNGEEQLMDLQTEEERKTVMEAVNEFNNSMERK